ncbi:MAG TPA: hypothetical protein VG474_02865, partial [Solirubrobacteraceae bacterium]|nr:hypothetical protein [Solirubrobacteraceae bacterium]
MEAAFGTLVWVVAAVGALVALFTLVGTGRSLRGVGGGGIVHDDDDAAGAAGEREAEIRQLLEARNVRRVRRGEAPLDVEAQRGELTRPPPAVDDELREELRRHVIARNARRVRAGAEPLDVEGEIERQ